MSRPLTAVVTIVHGRHEHLAGQAWGLARQTRRPDIEVVVAMGDPAAADRARSLRPGVLTPGVDLVEGHLPLAAARNRGARAAVEAGATNLVFLDVDCIPGEDLVHRYAEVLAPPDARDDRPLVACGEVAYLPPVADPADYRVRALATLAEPHPARPRPEPGRTMVADDVRLFWSLSFAIVAAQWERLGGFSEDYRGYGAEDTDFAQRLSVAGGTLLWVGGAPAYHQWHDGEVPPLRHLEEIVRNANTFHDRWGWFPMEGWLAVFAERGLAQVDACTRRWSVTTEGRKGAYRSLSRHESSKHTAMP